MLRNEEGVRNKIYKDHLGYDTIGVGHLVDKRKGGSLPSWAWDELNREGKLSDKSIDKLLESDINTVVEGINKHLPWALGLDEVRYGVLVDMAFQMGVQGLLGFKNTLAMIEKGDYAGASQGMLHSKWCGQTPNRCERRREEMRHGIFHEYP